MPLITYDQARPWADAIAHAVEMKMMPPWFADARYGHFANDNSLNDAQIAAITAWARAGAPAGSPYDAPPPNLGRRLEYSPAGPYRKDAEAGADSRRRRGRIHI